MKKQEEKEERENKHNFKKYFLLIIPLLIYIFLAVDSSNMHLVPERDKEFYKHESGYNYPHSVDSMSYYKQALDLSEGKKPQKISMLAYIEYSIFKIGQFFNPDFTLFGAIFYMPLILGVISLIFIFLITEKAVNSVVAFYSSIIFAIHPIILRTFQASYGDNGSLNILFSLIFIFLFFNLVESFEKKLNKKILLYGVLLLISTILFAYSWNGYYYILFITSFFIVTYFFLKMYKANRIKEITILFVIVIVVVFVSFILFNDQIKKSKLYIDIVKPKLTSEGYPETSASIQELQKTDFSALLVSAGWWPIFVGAIIGLLGFILTTSFFVSEKPKRAFKLYLSLYLIFALIGTARALRAQIFLGMISSIMAGAGIYYLSSLTSGLLTKLFNKRNAIKYKSVINKVAVIILLLITSYITIKITYQVINRPPLMEDSVYFTAKKIEQNSEKNALITSWWDEGSLYYAFSNRNVSVKAHPEPAIVYLTAKALSTNDENLSVGIFKILNCGNPRDEMIKKNLTYVIQNTNCSPSQHFLVLSSWVKNYYEIIYKYGYWNFDKQDSDIEKKVMGDFEICKPYNEVLICGNYTINTKTWEAKFNNKINISLIYPTEKGIYFKDKKTRYILILYRVGSHYETAAVRKDIMDSMFVRLYFMDGAGLKHFKKFSEINTAKRTIAYEIIYD
ncbi:MAG: hypothetical protein QXG86_03415 [Candidatus Woesearchaeota archaeon]